MIQLARRMARHAFGIGMAIGTILAPSIALAQPALSGPIAAPGKIDRAPQLCVEAQFLNNPTLREAQDWCEFVAFSRDVWNTIIGGNSDAPLYYRTSEPITGTGQYLAFDADGVPITVNVLASLNDNPGVNFGSDESSGILFATLDGPNGSIAIEALVNTVVIETGELLSHVTPVALLEPEVAQMLQAGGGFNALGAANCAAQAAAAGAAVYAGYAAAYGVCMASARAALSASLRVCARLLLIPKIGIPAAAACVAIAYGVFAASRASCKAILRRGAEAAAAAAAAAFAACMAAKAVMPVNPIPQQVPQPQPVPAVPPMPAGH